MSDVGGTWNARLRRRRAGTEGGSRPDPRETSPGTGESRRPRDVKGRLVLVGGPPGTGKSTLVRNLARARGYVALGGSDAEVDDLLQQASELLVRGASVVLDAPWDEPRDREAAEALAARTHSRLTRLHCQLPRHLVRAYVARRLELSAAPTTAVAHVVDEANCWPAWKGAHPINGLQSPQRCLEDALHAIAADEEVWSGSSLEASR